MKSSLQIAALLSFWLGGYFQAKGGEMRQQKKPAIHRNLGGNPDIWLQEKAQNQPHSVRPGYPGSCLCSPSAQELVPGLTSSSFEKTSPRHLQHWGSIIPTPQKNICSVCRRSLPVIKSVIGRQTSIIHEKYCPLKTWRC